MSAKRYLIKQKDGSHSVIESKTELVIDSFKDIKEARTFKRTLESGYGFNGWTPSFILKPKKEYV